MIIIAQLANKILWVLVAPPPHILHLGTEPSPVEYDGNDVDEEFIESSKVDQR